MLEHITIRHTPTPETDPAGTPGGDPADPEHTDPEHTAPADPTRIAATTGGAGFRLADCVDTLLHNVLQLAA